MYMAKNKLDECGISLWTMECERSGSNQVILTPVSTTGGPYFFWSTSTIESCLVLVVSPLTKLSKIYVLAPDKSQWMAKATLATSWASRCKNRTMGRFCSCNLSSSTQSSKIFIFNRVPTVRKHLP